MVIVRAVESKLEIPKIYPVWWTTTNKDNLAQVLDCEEYKGKYKEFFTHNLKLDAPNTINRYLWMSVNLKGKL